MIVKLRWMMVAVVTAVVVTGQMGTVGGTTQQPSGTPPDSGLTIHIDVVGRLLAATKRIDYASEPLTVDISGRWETDEMIHLRRRDRSAGLCPENRLSAGPFGQLFPADSRMRAVAFDVKTDKSGKLTGTVEVLEIRGGVVDGIGVTCHVVRGEVADKLPMDNLIGRGRTFTFKTQQARLRQSIDLNWYVTVAYDDLLIVTRQSVDCADVLWFHRPVAAQPVTVNGTVLIEGGAPTPQVALSFLNLTPDRAVLQFPAGTAYAQIEAGCRRSPISRSPVSPVTSTPDGARIRAELPASEYRVTVSGLAPGYVVKSITADSVDLLKTPLMIDVVPKRSKPRIQVTLAVDPKAWTTVSGRVSTAGKPPRGVSTVSLSHPAFRQAVEARIDSNGGFVFPMVLPGENTLSLGSGKNLRETTIHVDRGGLTNLHIETDTLPTVGRDPADQPQLERY